MSPPGGILKPRPGTADEEESGALHPVLLQESGRPGVASRPAEGGGRERTVLA